MFTSLTDSHIILYSWVRRGSEPLKFSSTQNLSVKSTLAFTKSFWTRSTA